MKRGISMKRSLGWKTFAAGGAALLLTACSGDEQPGPEELVENEACEHMKNGPAEAVTAQDSNLATLPPVAGDHRRYDLNLGGEASDRVGWVSYASETAGHHLFHLSSDVPLSIESSSGAVIEVEPLAFDACTEVARQYEAALEVGTYYLRVGPTSEATVGLVIEQESGAAHADHEE